MTTTLTATRKQSIIAVVFLASFVGVTYGFGIYIFSQLLPDMSRDLGFTYGQAGIVTASGQVGFIVFAFAGTWLCKHFNGTVVMIGSVLLCSICLSLVPLSPNLPIMGILLTITAGTSASVYVPLVEVVSSFVGPENRGVSLGVISSGTTYGVAVSAGLIPPVLHISNWKVVWLIAALVSIAVALAAASFFRSVGLINSVRALPSTDSGNEMRWKTVLPLFLTWAGLIWIIKFMNGFSFMSYQNFLSPLLRDSAGNSVNYASGVWITIAVIGMMSGLAVGRLGDRIGIRRTLMICYLLFFASSMILATAQTGPAPFIAAALFGLAFYPIYGLVPAYVSRVAAGSVATLIFGLANVTQGLGGVAGNITGGYVASSLELSTLYIILGCGAFVLAIATQLLPKDRSG